MIRVDLLTNILITEDGHLEWAEKQRAQTEQMGLETRITKLKVL